ncbi:hypothetical protein HQQ94_17340 [Shewanella sp. VB17]|uniref:hypothetical protein n=1 Tax=Shewanella sp. VB17 TaxID=2739432 RepID=UPI0015679D24|nr:hypothetical protein [Shewanella sp. VB17]NRD74947.1 hypothetical protein [Shewanella sp. VB17]
MSNRKIALLALCVIPAFSSAAQLCTPYKKIDLLNEHDYLNYQKKQYLASSDRIEVNHLFNPKQSPSLIEKAALPENELVYSETAAKLAKGPATSFELSVASSKSLLRSMGRTTISLGSQTLEALGPIGDAAFIGLWSKNIADTFSNESATSYDKFESIISLVDWFGLFKIAQRDIDAKIYADRWDAMASGKHYSYTLHKDLFTEQEFKDKEHWLKYATGYKTFLKNATTNIVNEVSMRYQLYYLDSVNAQTIIARQLISGIDQELYKGIAHLLSANYKGKKNFFRDNDMVCDSEFSALTNEGERPVYDLDTVINNFEQCQYTVLHNLMSQIYHFSKGEIPSASETQIRTLFNKAIESKIQIAQTAHVNIEQIKLKLINKMKLAGTAAINKLFTSGSVVKNHSFIMTQATNTAMDELVRSEYGRSITPTELFTGIIILEEAYQTCVSWSWGSCNKIGWVPAVSRMFEPWKDPVLSQITLPQKTVYLTQFDREIDSIIHNGWHVQPLESWFDNQISGFTSRYWTQKTAKESEARIKLALFDTNYGCESSYDCSGWSSSYLANNGITQSSSLHDIEHWMADYEGKNAPVHQGRIRRIVKLLPGAITDQWLYKDYSVYRHFAKPDTFDLKRFAPAIYQTLYQAYHEDHIYSQSELKKIAKTKIVNLSAEINQHNSGWLSSQIGDFHRYIALAQLQMRTSGHFAPNSAESSSVLFNEILPADIRRWMIADIPNGYVDTLKMAMDAFFSYKDAANWQAQYTVNLTTSLNVNHIHDVINVDFNSLALRQKIAAIIPMIETYNPSQTQAGSSACQQNLEPLYQSLWSIASDENLVWIPYLSDHIDDLAWYLNSMEQVEKEINHRPMCTGI